MKNISKYLEDKRFIEWVFGSDVNYEEWWESFQVTNPEEIKNINKARRILVTLKTNDKELQENEKVILFTKILNEIENKQHHNKTAAFFTNFCKYAAVAILFFSLGAIMFYKKNNFNPQFFTQNITNSIQSDEAMLIRPGGSNILLSEANSRIEHRDDGKVIINDDIFDENTPAKKGIPEMNQLVIPYGKTSEIILPDGTHVFLNAGSRLIYPDFFADKNREVFLSGEAFFDVKQDLKHPFIVNTTDIWIKVLGTQFNVSAYSTDNIIETVLTEGKVQLGQNNSGIFSETTELEPGQLAAFNKNEKTTKLKEVDIENYILWRNKLLKFESTDLSRVIKRLERYYDIRFKYDDPLLGSIKISGKLELSESQNSVLSNVADAASLKINKIGERFYEVKK